MMFHPVTEDLLDIALEMLNSNTHYNIYLKTVFLQEH